MIQLDNKKKIIILVIAILLIVVFAFVFINKKNHQINNQTPKEAPINNNIKNLPARIMTSEEKTGKVGIDPAQNAEVVNDQNGLYIYRIKK